MRLQRRQLLQVLSDAFGSSFNLPQNELAMAAQNPTEPASPVPPAKARSEEHTSELQSH